VQSGAGTLTLGGNNTYTGGTTVSGGILSVSAISDSGNSSIGPSGTVSLSGTGELLYTGSSTSTARNVAVSGTNSIVDVPSGVTLTITGAVSGGTLIKNDSGTLNLSGNTNDNSGLGLTINAGTVILSKTSGATAHAIGGNSATVNAGATLQMSGTGGYDIYHTGSVTVNSGGVFDVDGQSDAFGTLTLSGAGAGSGALINSAATTTSALICSVALSNNASIGGPGNITLSNAITGAYALDYIGSGTLKLLGANTYSGSTTISSGLLSLQTNGSLPNSSLSIASAAGFDVSKLGSTSYTLGGTSFTASGQGTVTNFGAANAAFINGASGGTFSLGSLPISLTFTPTSFTGDATHASLYVSQGALQLNGNSFTVNNASGTPLGAGTNVLIQQNGGSISGSGSYTVSVTGSGLVPGGAASISISGASVNLVVTASASIPTFNDQSITVNGSGNPVFSGSGTANAVYGVESKTNLLGLWIEAGGVTNNGTGAWSFTDLNQTNPPTIFYRLYNPDNPANPPQ
jgi:autotransporter-associated beta strand protein